MEMLQEFAEVLHSSLDAQTALRCSRFIQKYRVMGEPYKGNYSFKHHPWVAVPHDDNSEILVIMKGAQLGWTEFSINRMLYTLDQLKRNVGYILPTERPSAVNFSKGRLNTICELSPYFAGLFNKSNNESHKVTKYGNNLYIRGANSRNGLKEYNAGLMVLDELDEMSPEAIGLAKERLSGHLDGNRQLIMLSTPGITGKGIHDQFRISTQAKFFFKCPYCSKYITFEYPQSLVVTADDITDNKIRDSYYICYECKHKLEQREKPTMYESAIWVDTYPERPIKGYHVSQLYSCAFGPDKIAEAEVAGRSNTAYKTEFYNSKLGLPFVAEGSNITDSDINALTKGYLNNDLKLRRNDMLVTMGIDVGQETHHVSIVGWNLKGESRDITVDSVGKLLFFGKINNFDEAHNLMQIWQPKRVVIDAQPDTKGSISLCRRYMGLCFVCYYSITKTAKQIVVGNKNECSISVNRNFWLDATIGKFKTQTIELPSDLSLEFRNHLMSTTKVYKVDDTGNPFSEYYKKESEQDHYLHSLNYAMIALGMVAGSGSNFE